MPSMRTVVTVALVTMATMWSLNQVMRAAPQVRNIVRPTATLV